MAELLTDVDVRVLGSLIEKAQTTPEYYPMSLNALVNACNQTSNRDPVVQYDEATVARSIDALRHRGLVRAAKGIDARVTKYSHRADDVLGLNLRELSLLCVLMLRGPQTSGELRTRTDRFEPFDDIAQIESTLDGMIVRELVARLARQPGQKEVRYGQRLSGDEAIVHRLPTTPAPSAPPETDRIDALEDAIEVLRQELSDLRGQVEAFRAQFE